jgi:NADP-dependent 3-hydroxy acid dehydrogenase YdfG
MLLKDKVAVIYGAGAAIGGAVARAFAREGARLFLTGRHGASVQAVAKEIVSAGGAADAAEVDALDEKAIDRHLQAATDKASRIDISFNAVGLRNRRSKVSPSSSWTSKSSPYRLPPTPDRTSLRLDWRPGGWSRREEA